MSVSPSIQEPYWVAMGGYGGEQVLAGGRVERWQQAARQVRVAGMSRAAKQLWPAGGLGRNEMGSEVEDEDILVQIFS